jgi:hypothetical protein
MKKRLSLQNYLPDAYNLMKEMDAIIKRGINLVYLEMIKTRALSWRPSASIAGTGSALGFTCSLLVFNLI